jgi:hypothetical protein
MMSRKYNPDLKFAFPPGWLLCKHKYILIRECWAQLRNGHSPYVFPVGDIQLHASFVSEPYGDHFVCLTNSVNSKKKRFDYNYSDQYMNIWFTTLTGEPVYVEEFCFDFLLVGED